MMGAPSLPTIKTLFARSRNRCAFPDCSAPVVEESGTVTAEICHIRAFSPHGPRYDKNQTPEERNSADNLVLMCGRHHKIIDTETRKYTTATLLKLKREHEEHGFAEISPTGARIAEQLLANYSKIAVIGNRGNVAIQSPGAIQAKSITIKNSRTRLSVAPPVGSIGANRSKVAYCEHLIGRYQDYQKADQTGKSKFKFAAIHVALERTFGTKWKLLDEARFDELVAYLQRRIDATIVGKLNRSRGRPNYSSFETWEREA
jgi:hypothetical protein